MAAVKRRPKNSGGGADIVSNQTGAAATAATAAPGRTRRVNAEPSRPQAYASRVTTGKTGNQALAPSAPLRAANAAPRAKAPSTAVAWPTSTVTQAGGLWSKRVSTSPTAAA